jgi:hypothetical protein
MANEQILKLHTTVEYPMNADSPSTIGLAFVTLGFVGLFIASFAGYFLPAFEGDGAEEVKSKIRDGSFWALTGGALGLLALGIVVYLSFFESNQNMEGLMKFMYILVMVSFFLANMALLSSLLQVSVVKS